MNEDLFPIQDGDFPASYVCLPEGKSPFSLMAGPKEMPWKFPAPCVASAETFQSRKLGVNFRSLLTHTPSVRTKKEWGLGCC